MDDHWVRRRNNATDALLVPLVKERRGDRHHHDARPDGHGDLLIQQVAGRVISVAPPHTLVGRLGGDEFAILLPSVP